MILGQTMGVGDGWGRGRIEIAGADYVAEKPRLVAVGQRKDWKRPRRGTNDQNGTARVTADGLGV
jgi:hypothetical protein